MGGKFCMCNLPVKKIKLIYPPSALFQRGEERCQSNISSSTATSVRACNDLGYVASELRNKGYEIYLKDYQTEGLTLTDLLNDLKAENPDVLYVSVTNATIFDDIKIVNEAKSQNPDMAVVLKGAIFLNPEAELLSQLDLKNVDYLIGGEAEYIVAELIESHFNDRENLKNINGILYKVNGEFVSTKFDEWCEDLDRVSFPARDLMNNSLYLRPDTKEIQATIATSRGCPSSCIFCLTPHISGRKLRLRSVQNIFDEIYDCYKNHGIKNFFFKSDTFTYNKQWTLDLCNLIINSELQGKIKWVANSRTNPIDLETLKTMKKAGCWLVAFGFESGSEKSLKLMKKGTTIEQNLEAAKLAKKAGLKVFGFYLIGFPWEDMEDLNKTKDLIYKINADFIELHIATPFYGTELYEMAREEGLIDESVLGRDYFNAPSVGTKYLKIDEILKFRKDLLLRYHLRFSYILKKLLASLTKPKVIGSYFYYGIKLVKNCLKKS